MPVADNVPEPLKSALENMEAIVQSTKQSMAFAAPEMMDTFWIELQQALANEFARLVGSDADVTEAVERLWEEATINWDEDEVMFDSSTAYPGGSIKGKDLYAIGVTLGIIEPVDLGVGDNPGQEEEIGEAEDD